jgi:4-hydroxybenzoate polyprenyltransferase
MSKKLPPRPPARKTAPPTPGRPPAPRPVARAAPRAQAATATLPLPGPPAPVWLERLGARLPPHVLDRLWQYALLTRQDRPVGWLLLLWPTLWGLWLAAEGVPPIGTLLIFVLGVIVMRSAGCAINDWADRWLDPQVERTRVRPIAAGRVSPREALVVFAVLIAVALLLVLLTNLKTVQLACVAAVLAVVYPFMKRHTWVPQVWLGAAFGMSIPMAWTAVADSWPPPAVWLMFTGNILWATAYDTLYAMVDRDDDLRAGAKSTAILFGDLDLVVVGILQGSFLLAMAMLAGRAELGGAYWAGFAVALAVSAWQLWLARGRDRAGAFAAFRMSHWAGAALFVGLAADYAMA